MAHNHQPHVCPLCQGQKKSNSWMHGDLIRPTIVELIHQQHPEWNPHEGICSACLNQFLGDHVQQILKTEKGELTHLEHEVIDSLKRQELLAENVNTEFESQMTFGER